MRVVQAQLAIESDGQLVDAVAPDKRFHRNFERQPSTTVAIRSTALEDLYVVLVGWEPDGGASFLFFVNPLVVWLWLGGILALVGGVVAFWPEVQPRAVRSAQPARAIVTSVA